MIIRRCDKMLERSKNLFHSQTEEEVVFGFGLFWAGKEKGKKTKTTCECSCVQRYDVAI